MFITLKTPKCPKNSNFFGLLVHFCLITFLKIIGSRQIKMELLINFLPPYLSKKNIKNMENFHFTTFCK